MSGCRVLNVLGPSAGGIRQHVAVLSAGLGKLGWGVTVLGPDGVMAGLRPDAEVIGAPVDSRPDRAARSVRAIRRAARDASIIHAHGLTAATAVRLARTGLPTVVTVHNLVLDEVHGPLAPLQRRVGGWALKGAARVIVISAEIDAEVAPWVPQDRRRAVAPASAEKHPERERGATREALRVDPSTPLVAVVARLSPQKDLPTFLRAMVAVRHRVPAAQAVVVGDGDERHALEGLRDRLGLAGAVRFVGARENPADEMAAADVVALSSIWEGSPIAVVEALRLGRPLVTTAVGTVPHDLTDGVHARVVPPREPEALGAAIADLLEHPDDAAAMGERGRGVAQASYDTGLLVGRVADVYEELVPGPPERSAVSG
ncbi:MAG: glycosyltransferase family 4 protein [Microthrixaceae bacterium]